MVDFLEEIMKEDEDDDADGTNKLASNEDMATLKEEIAELNKEKAGLLKGVKAERSKRQEINGKLTQLTETVNGLLTNRDSVAKKVITDAAAANKAKGVPVTWTEEGEGFIKTEVLDEVLNPYKNEILNLKQQLEITNNRTSADSEAEKVRRAIVGEDERYDKAYSKYQAARRWVVDQVADFAKVNDITQSLTSGEALDNVFDSDAEAEFESEFPGIDLERIVTAEDSKRHFRNTMSSVAEAMTPSEDDALKAKPDSRFQKVMRKPSGLGTGQNAKAGEVSVMDKLDALTVDDLTNIDDATADKLLAAIAAEEKSGGVRF